jgi:UDP-galactose transporter B1
LQREGLVGVLGLRRLLGGEAVSNGSANGEANGKVNGHTNGQVKNGTANGKANGTANGSVAKRPWYQTLPGLLLQVSLFQTTAGPIGFHALKHISYPTMVLAKVQLVSVRPS